MRSKDSSKLVHLAATVRLHPMRFGELRDVVRGGGVTPELDSAMDALEALVRRAVPTENGFGERLLQLARTPQPEGSAEKAAGVAVLTSLRTVSG